MDDKKYGDMLQDGKSAREETKYDSLDPPYDIIQRKAVQIESLPFRVISVGKRREGKNFSYFCEGLDSFSFSLTLSGTREYVYRGKETKLCCGDMVFISSNVNQHVKNVDDENSFWFVNVEGTHCDRFEQLWNEGGLDVIRTTNIEKYMSIITRIFAELNSPYISSELTINALFTQLLTEALNEKYLRRHGARDKLYPSWINDAALYISEHCTEEISVSDLASRFYMNYNTFSRNFKKYMKQTPKEYQTSCRVQRAAALLGDADLSIVDIACKCGFSSQSFFTKTFRLAYGVTPAKYRANLLKTL
jgi:AraC-like DNA-binding protein